MPLTRIDSAFLDLDAIGGIDFDVQSGVPTLKVDAVNHRVGIGTNNPDDRLEIRGGGLKVINDDLLGYVNLETSKDTSFGSFTNYAKARGGSTPAIVQDDDNIGNLIFKAHDGIDYQKVARIEAYVDGTPGANDVPGRLEFHTRASGDNGTSERLRITSDGRITANGVSVNNAWAGGDDLVLGGTDSGTRTGITLVSGSDTDGGIYWSHGTGNDRYAGQIAYNHNSNMMTFYTDSSPQLRITSDGNITLGDSTYGSGLGQLRIINDASSAPASLALFGHNNTSDGDPFGQIQFAEQEAGTAGQIKAKIEAQAVSNNERGSDLVFFTSANSASSSPTERLRIDSDGKVLTAGAATVPLTSAGGIDACSGLYSVVIGGNTGGGSNQNQRTDGGSKEGRLVSAHKTNAEEPVSVATIFNLSTQNLLYFGGGSSLVNAATDIAFFTAANTTTTGGTERLRIDSDGIITAGNGNSTGGTTLIQNYYSSPHILNVIGSHYSTGGTSICYAVRPKAGNSGFVSSAGNAAFKKAALEINGEFVFRSAGAATVPVGDDVSLAQVMKIDVDGKIGVGFAAESATLEVQGQNVYTSSANSLATSTSKAALRVKGSTNSSDSLWVGVETSNAQPYLQGANGPGTGAKNLLLNPFGSNVGIGTTSPTSKLHVMGSIRVGLLATDTHESLLGTNALQFNRASSSYIDQKGTGNIKFRYGENFTTWMHLQGSTGNIGIGVDSPDVPLHVKTSANEVGKFETTNTADMSIELKNSQGSMYFGLGGGEEFAVATDSDLNGSNNLFAIKQDGKVGINTTGPTSRLHVRDDISYGKTSYASASTGSSQTRPPGTFRWGNQSPAGGSGRGYRAWVQSGDAYPSSSTYFDLMVRNAGFYRVTVKRSHSSASASVATMLIYGLANSTNSNYPVVFITGATGSGTSTATVQQGHGRGSSNAVASFYWEIHEYNINTHDTIIRIRTNASNNQGIIALVEEI